MVYAVLALKLIKISMTDMSLPNSVFIQTLIFNLIYFFYFFQTRMHPLIALSVIKTNNYQLLQVSTDSLSITNSMQNES